MPAISPRLGEFLIKTTNAKDINDAFHKVLSDYIELKLKNLEEIISKFETKWKVNFEVFKKKIKEGVFGKDAYSFSVEQDFWQWEEAETLKKHYETLEKQWI